jgi:hypothetical protein
LEKVKRIKQDASWLPETRGKAFNMVSLLLRDLPASERYRILFLERDLDEMLLSQEKMLERLGRTAAPRAEMKRSYLVHLERLHEWLGQQANMTALCVKYHDLIEHPEKQSAQIAAWLGGNVNTAAMAAAVEPSLYRNRKAAANRVATS